MNDKNLPDSENWQLEGTDESGYVLVNGDVSLSVNGTKVDAQFLLEALKCVSHDINLPSYHY